MENLVRGWNVNMAVAAFGVFGYFEPSWERWVLLAFVLPGFILQLVWYLERRWK